MKQEEKEEGVEIRERGMGRQKGGRSWGESCQRVGDKGAELPEAKSQRKNC